MDEFENPRDDDQRPLHHDERNVDDWFQYEAPDRNDEYVPATFDALAARESTRTLIVKALLAQQALVIIIVLTALATPAVPESVHDTLLKVLAASVGVTLIAVRWYFRP